MIEQVQSNDTKRCNKCGVILSISHFSRGRKDSKDGLQYRCKSCVSKYHYANKIKFNAHSKAYYKKHKHRDYLRHIWDSMIRRCYNPKHHGYKWWGGSGITVCQRWLDSFEDFKKDVGNRPTPKHQIDRINNDGNYEPGNVKWSTVKEQANNRRNNI